MSTKKLTPLLAARVYAKQTGTSVDEVRSSVEDRNGVLVEGADDVRRVVPVEIYSGRCHGRDFATFSVRPDTPGHWPVQGVGVVWADEALYSMESKSEFLAFVERVRDSIEAVELASLVATFVGKIEYQKSQNLVWEASDLDGARMFTPPGELDEIEGLGPLRVAEGSTPGMILDFFAIFTWTNDERRMTVNVVRWHVELAPSGLSWSSSLVASLPEWHEETPSSR